MTKIDWSIEACELEARTTLGEIAGCRLAEDWCSLAVLAAHLQVMGLSIEALARHKAKIKAMAVADE
jgi:hypothetical protein